MDTTKIVTCTMVVVFFLMIRRTPRSTRFPYTTLFRSIISSLAPFLRCSTLLLLGISPLSRGHGLPLEQLNLPAGFHLAVYAEFLDPRQLALGPPGLIFAGSRRAGNLYALIDADNDYEAEEVITIDSNLTLPSGIAFKDGDLYVGAVSKLLVYKDIKANLHDKPEPEILYDQLPDKSHHGWKYLKFGPDQALYFNIGAPCNTCLSDNPWFATIMRLDIDKRPLQPEIYAHGIRNTVGFAWHPATEELWFTDNGRDMLGDDVPACEINRISSVGQHFGFPYIHQGDLPDPVFGAGKSADDYTPPVLKLGAHVAPLGLVFYRGEMFPDQYGNTILWAEHGSWNRSEKSGYKVMMGRIGADNRSITETSAFVEGWLQGQNNWGRSEERRVGKECRSRWSPYH